MRIKNIKSTKSLDFFKSLQKLCIWICKIICKHWIWKKILKNICNQGMINGIWQHGVMIANLLHIKTQWIVYCTFYCFILVNVRILIEPFINSPPTLVRQSFFYNHILNSPTINYPSRSFLGNCKLLQGWLRFHYHHSFLFQSDVSKDFSSV